jgi:hypothetical protein
MHGNALKKEEQLKFLFYFSAVVVIFAEHEKDVKAVIMKVLELIGNGEGNAKLKQQFLNIFYIIVLEQECSDIEDLKLVCNNKVEIFDCDLSDEFHENFRQTIYR